MSVKALLSSSDRCVHKCVSKEEKRNVKIIKKLKNPLDKSKEILYNDYISVMGELL